MTKAVVEVILENKKICAACDSETTYITKQGYEFWHNHDGYRLCQNCYVKYVQPSKSKEDIRKSNIKTHRKWSPRRITFKGKRVLTYGVLRKGKCSKCGKKIGDEYINRKGEIDLIKRTNMHHWFYLIIMPWSCTEELCVPCHRKKSKCN